MTLLNRLFSSRKKSHKQGYVTFGKNEYESWKPFNFSKEQVRVLLFRECDWRGRKLLFDSKAVQKVPIESQSCSKLKFGQRQKNETKKPESFVEITNGIGYQYMRPNSDVTVLGEMIFGSVAMSFQGSVSKVHTMKSPSRLMCTRVFHSPGNGPRSRGASDRSLDDSCGSSITSISEYYSSVGSFCNSRQASIGSGPLDIELRSKHQFNSLEVDSGFCGDASLQSASSVGSTCGFGTYKSSPDSRRSSGSYFNSLASYHSGGSLASLQRRFQRNMSTSLELGSSSWSSRSNVDDDDVVHTRRRTKLGLAVVISVTPEEEKEMNLFLFEHMVVLDGMMERLHSAVEHAYLHKEMFVHLMMEGCQDMQQWLVDIFSAPRLTCPVWLGLTSGLNQLNSALSYNFLQDLCQLIATIDTKATNFFVSTLVTAVLTHHLGWVATILPGKMPPQLITKNPCTGQLLDALSKSHPYNPLWAQLGELCGALGYPTKIAKTIVTSGVKKIDLLNRILNSLTYFIRCSEVEKRVMSDKEPESTNGDSKTTLVNARSQSSFSRTFLSGHDVMEVFDNRVDPGVEIGRELQGEISTDTLTNMSLSHDSSGSTITFKESSLKSMSEYNSKKDSSQPQRMRRTASYVQKIDSFSKNEHLRLNNSSGRLYPTLADLQFVEDEMKENEPPVISEDISSKISRLIRVPPKAVLYHLQEQDSVKENMGLQYQEEDAGLQFQPKKVESERQRSAPVPRSSKWTEPCIAESCKTIVGSSPSKEIVEKSENVKDGVIFVLGDDEELVNLKYSGKCESVEYAVNQSSDKCIDRLHDCEIVEGGSRPDCVKSNVSSPPNPCPSGEKHSSMQSPNATIGFSSHRTLSDEDPKTLEDKADKNQVSVTEDCLGNSSNRVVMVRPSVIELEDECGGVNANFSKTAKPAKPVTRSLSLSCPLSSDKKCKNSSLCRRHSDCMCSTSRYLKDYHSVRFHFEGYDGVLENYLEGGDGKKASIQADKKMDQLSEARCNFCSAACEKCDNAMNRKNSVRDLNANEGNAMFEACNNLSDDDALFSDRISGREENSAPVEPQATELIEEFPVPRCTAVSRKMCGFAASLMGGTSDHYIPDLVLQGCTHLPKGWELNLRRDLSLIAHHPLLDQEVSEAVCIVANVETWEVQLVSSHTYVVDKPGTVGVRVGMSRLVANMLESLLYLWRLKTSPEHCLLHLESKLRELFLRSQALAELLLTTEFCDMELLTTSLDLDANDVPLLLAIAATHTPQVAERYGLSFRHFHQHLFSLIPHLPIFVVGAGLVP